MLKKLLIIIVLVIFTFSLVSCVPNVDDNNNNNNGDDNGKNKKTTESNITPTPENKGDPVPTYTVDWPTAALPEGFPILGKVTKVSDKRVYGATVTIYWNMITQDQIEDFVDKLNDYLDYDHEWQEYFYSDGLKYKPGTEEEYVRVVIRHIDSASGAVGDDFDPQFFLEISGPWVNE